jgi:hypothetical protein
MTFLAKKYDLFDDLEDSCMSFCEGDCGSYYEDMWYLQMSNLERDVWWASASRP